MAVPNVSAISLKSCFPIEFHQPLKGTHMMYVKSAACTSSVPANYVTLPHPSSTNPVYSLHSVTRRMLSKSYFGHFPAEIGRPIPQCRSSRTNSWKPCKVKSEDSEGTLSNEATIMDEQALEKELQNAIEQENYTQAAKIRDSLRFLHEDNKASVLSANTRFYNSFRQGDLASMQDLWSKGNNVCCVHPGIGGISGYDLVMGSWEFVWADYKFPLEIEVKNVEVHVRGDIGYVTCMEVVKTKGSSWGKQFATNVFEKIEGQWFICIHHASYIDL